MKAMTPPEYFFGPHFLGTDHVGRDILSRCIFGARVSLAIALAVVVISGAVGVLLGVISGYFGKFVDFGIQKIVEVMWAFPPLLLAIAVLAFLGQGLSHPHHGADAAALDSLLPRHARQRAHAQGTRVRDGGALAGRDAHAHHLQAPAAQPHAVGARDRHVRHGVRHHRGSGALLPRPRRSPVDSHVGRHAGGRAHLHLDLVVDGAVSRACASSSQCSPSTCWATPCATISIRN